jgi:methylmalonyl-CoA mutase N-terminal domain/subunit
MSKRFGAKNESAMKLRFHTQTGGSTLTAQQPENNAVRVAFQALAAVLGGSQSLHTNSMDEALWLPTENAVRLALRTQQIIAYESGVVDSVDPLAGSYLVEYLTNQIEEAVQTYLSHIDQMGGALQAIEQGYIQGEIQDAAYRYQREIETGEQILVGVNAFQIEENIDLERLQVDPGIEAEQCSRLKTLRANRDQNQVAELLSRLEVTAKSDENLMPIFIECVENKITLGEICAVLRQVWGEYQPPAWG